MVFPAAIREKSQRGVALSCDAHVMSARSGEMRQPCTVLLGNTVSCETFLTSQHFCAGKSAFAFTSIVLTLASLGTKLLELTAQSLVGSPSTLFRTWNLFCDNGRKKGISTPLQNPPEIPPFRGTKGGGDQCSAPSHPRHFSTMWGYRGDVGVWTSRVLSAPGYRFCNNGRKKRDFDPASKYPQDPPFPWY